MSCPCMWIVSEGNYDYAVFLTFIQDMIGMGHELKLITNTSITKWGPNSDTTSENNYIISMTICHKLSHSCLCEKFN